MTEQQFSPHSEEACVDPGAVFTSPVDVVNEARLSRAQKVKILRRWEYDALELQVAIEENMAPEQDSDLLDRVLDALHSLGTGPDVEHAPPTKQGST